MKKTEMIDPAQALPGRHEKMPVPEAHFVNGNRLEEPFPDGLEKAMFGLGCFWGAERKFWQLEGGLLHRCRLCWRLHVEYDL